MKRSDFELLVGDVIAAVLSGSRSVAILGFNTVTLRLLETLRCRGIAGTVDAIYAEPEDCHAEADGIACKRLPYDALARSRHDVLVVAADEAKEAILEAAIPFIQGTPKVIVSGYGHLQFDDRGFSDEFRDLLVPSLANGYPHTLTHLYQCLGNAARLGLEGCVAEFGMFKGGTSMLLARWIERLGKSWPVIGFDTFSGFPPRRSPLDMYDHPDCVFTDLASVQRYVAGRRIEVVAGDIVETCHRLDQENLVLTFIDTDNYTPARAAIAVVQERTVVGGSIVFDHFTGVDRFRYTLGERIAAKVLLRDSRYFNLHSTGVFLRQR